MAAKLIKVKNTNPKFGSNPEYYCIDVCDGNETRRLMLTRNDLDDAEVRALKNSEDWPKPELFTFENFVLASLVLLVIIQVAAHCTLP